MYLCISINICIHPSIDLSIYVLTRAAFCLCRRRARGVLLAASVGVIYMYPSIHLSIYLCI